MRILAVDDDHSTRLIVSKLLADRGYEVDSASDGPQALQMVRQRPYDLVILDYAMPLMNGVELFQHIHKLRPEMVGIFLTAHTRVDTVFPAVDAGVARVLSKPVDGKELLTVVGNLTGSSNN
ncbi:MAG: response regulator [Planctomycetia bacterium]|nr:response regulator [Planctomycetia bacterium]